MKAVAKYVGLYLGFLVLNRFLGEFAKSYQRATMSGAHTAAGGPATPPAASDGGIPGVASDQPVDQTQTTEGASVVITRGHQG